MVENILEVENLKKYFPITRGLLGRVERQVKAVDGVSFNLERRKVLGVAGESGCGKTTLGRTILRIYKPDNGKILFDGKDLLKVRGREINKLRRNMQIIFQDPGASLSPRMRIKDTLSEPFVVHKDTLNLKGRLQELLYKVGLEDEHLQRYPHELSGGQKQRVAIARAIALNPSLLVLDEPTSFLDVSVQAQILNLLKRLQADMGLSYIFISHHLSVISHISDQVAIMYAGKIIENAPQAIIMNRSLHPYTRALFAAVPVMDLKHRREKILLGGEPPSQVSPPLGCRFHPRCSNASSICREKEPPLTSLEGDHKVACHLFD